MSSNRHKTTMCNLCGKVMRGDNLKKHKIKKHSNSDTSLHHAEVHLPIADIVIGNQHNDEVEAKDSEIEEEEDKKIFMVKTVAFIQSNMFTEMSNWLTYLLMM